MSRSKLLTLVLSIVDGASQTTLLMVTTVTSQFSALDQTFFFSEKQSGAVTISLHVLPRISQSSRKTCLICAPVVLERSLGCLWCPPTTGRSAAAEMTDMIVRPLFSALSWAFPRSDYRVASPWAWWLPDGSGIMFVSDAGFRVASLLSSGQQGSCVTVTFH